MSFLQRLFGPKISKLTERGDVDGLRAVVESEIRSELRVAAVAALATLDDDRAQAALAVVLASPDVEVARAAESALRGLGEAAAEPLADALGSEAGEPALAILLDLGEAAVEPLRNASSAADEPARARALAGLLELHQRLTSPEMREAVFRTLLASIGDRSPTLRTAAASGLEALGDPRAARALAAQLKDGDEAVRDACRQALSRLGEPTVPYLVDALADRNANSRRLAAELIGELCSDGVDCEARREVLAGLLAAVADSVQEVRAAVGRALERVPAADVVAAQLELLADPERSDRGEILALLRQLLAHAALEDGQRTATVERIRALGFVAER